MKRRLVIKKDEAIIDMDRDGLVTISPTADGIVFNFRSSYFYVTDTGMPATTKNMIVSSYDGFKNGNIEIDLNNYNKPVSVKL